MVTVRGQTQLLMVGSTVQMLYKGFSYMTWFGRNNPFNYTIHLYRISELV